jgi:hypothetical protein
MIVGIGMFFLVGVPVAFFAWSYHLIEMSRIENQYREERAQLQTQVIARQHELLVLQDRLNLASQHLVVRLIKSLGLGRPDTMEATVIEALGYFKPGGIGGGSDEDKASERSAGSGVGRVPEPRRIRGTNRR